jgi:hypothetical protein
MNNMAGEKKGENSTYKREYHPFLISRLRGRFRRPSGRSTRFPEGAASSRAASYCAKKVRTHSAAREKHLRKYSHGKCFFRVFGGGPFIDCSVTEHTGVSTGQNAKKYKKRLTPLPERMTNRR